MSENIQGEPLYGSEVIYGNSTAGSPYVISIYPGDGSIMPASGDITVTFNEPMNQSYTEAAFSIFPAVTGTFSWNGNGDIMTFCPDADLSDNTTYRVYMASSLARDITGELLDGNSDGTHNPSDVWSTKTDLPTGRSAPVAAAVGNQIYVIGGSSGSRTSIVEIYDTLNDTWSTGSPMPTARSGMGCAVVDGKIYVMGGGDGTNTFDVVEVYNTANDTWTTRAPMSIERRGVMATTLNGRIYAIGGYDVNASSLSLVEVYDPWNDTWSIGTPMPHPTAYSGVGIVNGMIYIIEGSVAGTMEYCPQTDSWADCSSPPTSRMDLTAGVVNGRLYAIGGTDTVNWEPSSCNEAFDALHDTWAVKSDMPTARFDPAAATVNGKIYVFGGGGSSGIIKKNEMYIPNDDYSWYFIAGPAVSEYTVHAPIRIDSNSEFDLAHGVTSGSGTEADPWIIENWDINGTGAGDCIYVGNTTNHFIIRNCNLHDAGGPWVLPYFTWASIGLNNVGNGRVTNNTGPDNKYGIHMYSSDTIMADNNTFQGDDIGIFLQQSSIGNTLADNVISDANHGISLYDSLSNAVFRNRVTGCNHGIHVYSFGGNTLDGNIISNNTYGIYVDLFDSNVLSNNTVSNNDYGIFLEDSNSNTIIDNEISSNSQYGIYLNVSEDNSVSGNNIQDNLNQAYDNSGNNQWNSPYPAGGNRWSDYNGTDQFSGPGQNESGSDGMGDTPYMDIQGGTGVRDNYPLMESITYCIHLTAGWNLVSIPLIQLDTAVPLVLGSIDGQYDLVKYYDPMDLGDHWKTYSPYRANDLNDLSGIDLKMGFWIHMNNPGDLTVIGVEPVSTSIPLYAGWNLVGYPTLNNTVTLADALWGTGADRVEVCDLAEPYLVREIGHTYVMQPGEGYWVHVPADTVWTVDW